MNPSDPIAALEIGTTNTVIAIAEPLGGGRIRVAAYDSIPSNGVRKSQIIDVAQARYSVSSVQKKLVAQSDYAVAQAYLVISGPQIRTQEAIVQIPLPRGVVGDEDIEESPPSGRRSKSPASATASTTSTTSSRPRA